MRDVMRPGGGAKPNTDRRRVEQAVVGWVGLNVVCVIIWAMSGRGPFWPGWIMLLSAVVAVLRSWRRRTMNEDDAGRARSRRR
ncbi:MAG TPA: hypothetical protein VMF65_04470 [Acidimicrobiales bacterium]|nr:hypothetical protein [Acidimicrobiales bacterium]